MLNSFSSVLTVLEGAGRSVWYDRHVGIVEVAGSNPAQSIAKCLDGCCCASTVMQIYEADSG